MLNFCLFRHFKTLQNNFSVPKHCYRQTSFYQTYLNIVARYKHTFSPRRAILYVPGHDMRKIDKIPSLGVDCAVLDLEDGVAINKKDEARKLISNISTDFNFGKSEFAVRVNSVDSGLFHDDLAAVFSGKKFPSTIMIPKVENSDQAQIIIENINSYIKKLSFEKDIKLVFFTESARSLLDLREICDTTIKLTENLSNQVITLEGLVFGSDDFCASIGATRSAEGFEILTARQMFVMIAKSFGLQAIDMVHINYKDLDGLKLYSKQGADMGFTGKQVIHPDQVAIVQQAFSPSKEKVEWAVELIQLFEEHQKHGTGAFTFHGAMIDKPLLLQAKNIIELSKMLNQNESKS